jgi:hypothetical protein
MSKSTPASFWRKVLIGPDPAACWPWSGQINSWGYGDCHYQGRRTSASRVAYALYRGTWPKDGEVVCHSCDNPICCNPAHLWLGRPGDNVRDCHLKGRGRHRSGLDHPRARAKLDWETAERVKDMHAIGMNQTVIAKYFGVHSSTISRLVRGEYWNGQETKAL